MQDIHDIKNNVRDTKQSVIYVGLSDADTHDQRFDTEKYVSVLKNVCRSYHTGFSFHTITGGYFHDEGTYVEENTLVVTLVGTDSGTVLEIARDLCAFFRQESVMVAVSEAKMCYVSAEL